MKLSTKDKIELIQKMKLIAEYEIEYKGWYWVHKMKLSAREEIEYLQKMELST